MNRASRELLPGLLLLGLIGATANLIGEAVPLLSPLVLAIGIGAVITNIFHLPGWAERGVTKHSLILEIAIVLLGASLSLRSVITAGPVIIALVIFVVAFGLLLVHFLSRVAKLNHRIGSLLAAGASICGVSAIAVVAPICEAEDPQIAHAAATILLFDAVTLVVFPIFGNFFQLDPDFYGVWIGLSMFSTGPVAAAGFAHSAIAGKWATITKLARNALIGILAVLYSYHYTKQTAADEDAISTKDRLWSDFPKFLIGFFALVVFTNIGVIPSNVVSSIDLTSEILFLIAFAGLGLDIRFTEIRDTGIVPTVVVGTYLVTVSLLTYILVALFF
jgi:uncharacterized integral membrane protein (TIGR00698 family)